MDTAARREAARGRRVVGASSPVGTRLLRRQDARRYPSACIMGEMPTVTMFVPGPLRAYCGGASELVLSAHTVRGALESLERSQSALYCNVCDETGAVRRHLNVFVNADNVRDLDGVDTVLTPGDVVTILPAVSGG